MDWVCLFFPEHNVFFMVQADTENSQLLYNNPLPLRLEHILVGSHRDKITTLATSLPLCSLLESLVEFVP